MSMTLAEFGVSSVATLTPESFKEHFRSLLADVRDDPYFNVHSRVWGPAELAAYMQKHLGLPESDAEKVPTGFTVQDLYTGYVKDFVSEDGWPLFAKEVKDDYNTMCLDICKCLDTLESIDRMSLLSHFFSKLFPPPTLPTACKSLLGDSSRLPLIPESLFSVRFPVRTEFGVKENATWLEAQLATLPPGWTKSDFSRLRAYFVDNGYRPPDEDMFFEFPSAEWSREALLDYIDGYLRTPVDRSKVPLRFLALNFYQGEVQGFMNLEKWGILTARIRNAYLRASDCIRRAVGNWSNEFEEEATSEMIRGISPKSLYEFPTEITVMIDDIEFTTAAWNAPRKGMGATVVETAAVLREILRGTHFRRTEENEQQETLDGAASAEAGEGAAGSAQTSRSAVSVRSGRPLSTVAAATMGSSDDRVYYSSYTCLLQSSCCGKSNFLIKESIMDSDSYYFVAVINCEKVPNYLVAYENYNVYGYSAIAAAINDLKSSAKLAKYLAALRYEIYNKIRCEDGSSPNEYGLKPEYYMTGGQLLEKLITKETLERLKPYSESLDRAGVPLRPLKTEKGQSVHIVLVFDEAGVLLANEAEDRSEKVSMAVVSHFRHIRRALSHLEHILPVIFASTNSHISNFLPGFGASDSSRMELSNEIQNVKTRLHRPIVIQETFDIFDADGIAGASVADRFRFVQSDDYLYNLVNFGRPIWGAYMSGMRANEELLRRLHGSNIDLGSEALFNAVKFASQKICTRTPPEHLRGCSRKERLEFEAVALSCLYLTAYLRPTSTLDYGSQLVKSNMAFLYKYEVEMGRHIVGYPSEPILSCGASRMLREHPALIIGHLRRMSSDGSIDPGADGELAIRILLVYIMLQMPVELPADSRLFTTSGPVKDAIMSAYHRTFEQFMTCLLGGPVVSELRSVAAATAATTEQKEPKRLRSESVGLLAKEMVGGVLCFNHFSSAEIPKLRGADAGKAFEDFLWSAVIRCSAITPPPNERAVDLILPVVCTDSVVCPILIQVKNSFSFSSFDVAFASMDEYAAIISVERCLHVIFHVCSEERSVEFRPRQARFPGIVVKGLAGPLFEGTRNEALCTALKGLIQDCSRGNVRPECPGDFTRPGHHSVVGINRTFKKLAGFFENPA